MPALIELLFNNAIRSNNRVWIVYNFTWTMHAFRWDNLQACNIVFKKLIYLIFYLLLNSEKYGRFLLATAKLDDNMIV